MKLINDKKRGRDNVRVTDTTISSPIPLPFDFDVHFKISTLIFIEFILIKLFVHISYSKLIPTRLLDRQHLCVQKNLQPNLISIPQKFIHIRTNILHNIQI